MTVAPSPKGRCGSPITNCLLWSDIPANRIMRLTTDGQVSVFRADSGHTNGNTRDREGRLVSCEHRTRRVTRTEIDGTITVLADSFEGKPLNSPNDVVVQLRRFDLVHRSRLWAAATMSRTASSDQAHDNVFRIDPASGALTAVATDFDKPNGLAFSPDESLLYVADSAITDGPGKNSHIRRFRVNADGTLSGGEVFATTIGVPDGMRVDIAGNVWASAGAKIDVYAPDATLARPDRRLPGAGDQPHFRRSADGTGSIVTAGGSLFSVQRDREGRADVRNRASAAPVYYFPAAQCERKA